MKSKLNDNMLALLTEVVRDRAPQMLALIPESIKGTLKVKDIDDLCQTITDELCFSGLERDEPNQRGVMLEDLIDWLCALKKGKPH